MSDPDVHMTVRTEDGGMVRLTAMVSEDISAANSAVQSLTNIARLVGLLIADGKRRGLVPIDSKQYLSVSIITRKDPDA